MPRQARLDFPGTLHHVIFRGIEKRKIVTDNRDRDNFVTRLGRAAAETGTVIYAWALMRNHAHILLRSGRKGLSKFMRKLLTGYAVSYNRRHNRHGYLFQNRYKSIVCEEEPYFLELLRYIHLNPMRAGLVSSLNELDRYPYCGHSVLMGNDPKEWQDRDYVLSQFGTTEGKAQREYGKFIYAGSGQGRRPELVGGGLLRSAGGWSQVISMRRKGEVCFSNGRILGSSKFVERLVEETEDRQKKMFSGSQANIVKEVLQAVCRKEGVNISELQGGSRRRIISQMRMEIAHRLIEGHGVPMATIAREVGVTTSAISKMMKKDTKKVD